MPSASRKRPNDTRSARMELRVRPGAKSMIQRAMALTGLSAGDLALQAAQQVVAEHERMVLAGADRDRFIRLLADPPEPTPRLRRAFARHRRATG